jgi:hypothetical protein
MGSALDHLSEVLKRGLRRVVHPGSLKSGVRAAAGIVRLRIVVRIARGSPLPNVSCHVEEPITIRRI